MIDSILQYDKQLLLSLNGSHSLFADGLMLTLTDAKTWIPMYVALLYLVIKNNNSMTKILAIIAGAALCVLFTGTLDDLFVKPVVARWRPTHDPEIGYMVDVVDGYRGGRYGFFSALINCWTRIYLGVHYPIDIAVGLLWGAFVAVLVYVLFNVVTRSTNGHNNYISTQYTSTGYVVTDTDVVVSVFVFTLMYALVRASIII